MSSPSAQPLRPPHFVVRAASFGPAQQAGGVGGYYPWLDVLRGLSWIMVVVGHTILPLQYVASMGVAIFFAISGWLITKIILAERESHAPLTGFYARRCLRILPLYAAVVAMACAVSYVYPAWKDFFPFLPDVCASYKLLPYLATFSSEYWRGGGGGLLVGHCWSLCVEERFYIFWPLIVAVVPNRVAFRRSLIVFVVAAWFLTLRGEWTNEASVGLSFLPFPLLLGCGLALFLPQKRLAISNLWTIPAALVSLVLFWLYADQKFKDAGFTIAAYSLHAGVLAMAVVACAVLSRSAPRAYLVRMLQSLGKLSYAAYLIHPIFAFIGIKVALELGSIYWAPVVAVALCAPCAYALHRWFELPILESRRAVQSRAGLRYLCAGVQVLPIVAGLLWLFPWRALGAKVLSMPQIIMFIAVAAALAWMTAALHRRLAALRQNGKPETSPAASPHLQRWGVATARGRDAS